MHLKGKHFEIKGKHFEKVDFLKTVETIVIVFT